MKARAAVGRESWLTKAVEAGVEVVLRAELVVVEREMVVVVAEGLLLRLAPP